MVAIIRDDTDIIDGRGDDDNNDDCGISLYSMVLTMLLIANMRRRC